MFITFLRVGTVYSFCVPTPLDFRWQLTDALGPRVAQQVRRDFYWQLLLPIYTLLKKWTLKGANLNSIKEMVRSVAGFKASDSHTHIKLKFVMES